MQPGIPFAVCRLLKAFNFDCYQQTAKKRLNIAGIVAVAIRFSVCLIEN